MAHRHKRFATADFQRPKMRFTFVKGDDIVFGLQLGLALKTGRVNIFVSRYGHLSMHTVEASNRWFFEGIVYRDFK